jgi:NAD(P)-dependent dehydrogenase (short-subunit alcohol dehydrogenase family)
MDLGIGGRVALVTGGTRIGLGIAKALADEGACGAAALRRTSGVAKR